MRARVLMSLLLGLTLWTTGPSANAKTVFSSGDWVLNDSNPDQPGVGVCVATTATYFTGRAIHYLDVIVDKTGARPLEVMVRPRTAPSTSAAFQANIGQVYSFVSLPLSDGIQYFWGVPRGTEALIQYLKQRNQFNVVSVGGTRGTLPFSLRGSSATLNQLESSCAALSLFTGADFERRFLPSEVGQIDALAVTPEIALALRETLARGVVIYREILAIQSDLDELESRYADWTRELASVRAQIRSNESDLANQQAQRDRAQARIDQAIAEISRLQTQLAQSQEALASAQSELRAAQEAIAPYKPENDRLLGLVEQSQRQVRFATNRLNQLDRDIRDLESEIDGLERRLDQLGRESNDVDFQLRRAEQDLRQAENRRRNFDRPGEIRRRKNADSRLSRLENEINRVSNELGQRQRDLNRAERERDQAAQRLRQCQGRRQVQSVEVDAVVIATNEGDPGDDNGRGDGKGRGRKPRPNPPRDEPNPPRDRPNPPRDRPNPPPEQDCSRFEQDLNRAESEVRQIRNDVSRLENERSRFVNQKNSIERDIENQVDREFNELVRDENQARARVDRLRSQLDSIEREMRQIANVDLPDARSELGSKQGQRSGAVDDLRRAQADLAQNQQALANYRASVGYDALENRVNEALALVSRIQSQISETQGLIAQEQRVQREQTAERNRLDARIAQLQNTLLGLRSRESELVKLLEPYEQEKSPILARLQEANQRLTGVTGEFRSQLP